MEEKGVGVIEILADRCSKSDEDQAQREAELYHQIGQLTMEVEYLKKVRVIPVERRREMIDRKTNQLSISKQCEFSSISRSGLYYVPKGIGQADVSFVHQIDRQYTKTPFYCVERMTEQLHRDGIVIGHNRIRRLMRLDGACSGIS